MSPKLPPRVSRPALGAPLALLLAWAGSACDASAMGPQLVGEDLADLPLAGSDEQQRRQFRAGDALFETAYRESDGLGPLYIRSTCGACHTDAGKGPGLVRKLQIVGPDGVIPVDAPEDLPWGNTLRPYTAGSATRPLAPTEVLPPGHQLRVSERIGPTVLMAGFSRLNQAYAARPGPKLPPVPSTWSSVMPSAADLATDFGQLYGVLSKESDPEASESLVSKMNAAAAAMAIPVPAP